MPTLGELLAERLLGIARSMHPAIDAAARAAETPPTPRRWLVCWADCEPMQVGISMLLEWWPDSPEIRSYVLSLHPGETWIDPETTDDGRPVCAVIRLE